MHEPMRTPEMRFHTAKFETKTSKCDRVKRRYIAPGQRQKASS